MVCVLKPKIEKKSNFYKIKCPFFLTPGQNTVGIF